MSGAPYIFYGDPISLYAGKVRCYLRKKQLPAVERKTSHPGYYRWNFPAENDAFWLSEFGGVGGRQGGASRPITGRTRRSHR